MDQSLADFLDSFTQILNKPYEFLSAQEDTANHIKDLTKQLYDYTKSNEEHTDKNTLPNLIVHKFDEEQIWQQLELQNESRTKDVIQSVSHLSAKIDKLDFPLKLKCIKTNTITDSEETVSQIENKEDEETAELEISDVDEDEEDGEEDEDEVSDDEISHSKPAFTLKKGKSRPSIVDDRFFKLSELEIFLQNEEKPKKENETFDLFDNIDNEAADYKYSDFFENPEGDEEVQENGSAFCEDNSDEGNDIDEENDVSRNGIKRQHEDDNDDVPDSEEDENEHKKEGSSNKKVRFDLLGSDKEDSDSESNDGFMKSKKKENKADKIKSTLELRQERLGRMIEKLEEDAVSEKPWQLKGEVTATVRPQNSLLEETLDFDLSVRPAPVITGEVTMRLEDIIMQRIKDKAWDDVERKVKPVSTPAEFKKKLALDQEKSKLSLAEVYEQAFIKQREAASTDDTERQETEPALHVEVRSMLHSLFNKLDALSNYHYTPRPVAPELKVVSNVAAISMEEVAPVSVTDAALLAPQEIKGKKRRSELMSKEEMTVTDKKRARRLKKTRQRQRQRDKVKAAKEVTKLNPGLGNKHSKLRAENQVLDITNNNVTKMEESKEKTVKTSSAFFDKLQDEVKSQIRSKTALTKKKNKWNITVKKLKL